MCRWVMVELEAAACGVSQINSGINTERENNQKAEGFPAGQVWSSQSRDVSGEAEPDRFKFLKDSPRRGPWAWPPALRREDGDIRRSIWRSYLRLTNIVSYVLCSETAARPRRLHAAGVPAPPRPTWFTFLCWCGFAFSGFVRVCVCVQGEAGIWSWNWESRESCGRVSRCRCLSVYLSLPSLGGCTVEWRHVEKEGKNSTGRGGGCGGGGGGLIWRHWQLGGCTIWKSEKWWCQNKKKGYYNVD